MTKLTKEQVKFFIETMTDDMHNTTQHKIAETLLSKFGECESLQAKLLAYEQAAKNPIGSFHISGGQVEATTDYCRDGEWPVQDGEVLVYAAPVLPKQPELVDLSQQVEILNRILNWILKELPVPTQKASAMAIRLSSVIDIISDLEVSAPAQPKQPKPTISFYRDGIIAAAKWVENQRDAYDNEHGQSDPETGSFEFGNNAQLEYSTTLSEIAEGIRSLHSVSAQPVSEPYKLAANDIIAERQRQISEEGWTPEHDDKYNDFQLALAAAGYAQNVADYAGEYCQPNSSIDWTDAPEPEAWPWSPVWWKPSNPRRDLVKAGALILAEIERLDRAAPAQESEQHG